MMNGQSFFEDVIGEWEGKGSLFGMEASFKMKWTNELEGKFVRLTFQNKFTDQNGIERIMDAHAYYDPSLSNGTWFDTHGMMLPLQLNIEENVLIVLWGNAETRQGKTIYTIDSTGERWSWKILLKETQHTLHLDRPSIVEFLKTNLHFFLRDNHML